MLAHAVCEALLFEEQRLGNSMLFGEQQVGLLSIAFWGTETRKQHAVWGTKIHKMHGYVLVRLVHLNAEPSAVRVK